MAGSLALVEPAHYLVLFQVTAFVLGAVVGSFLNVCIYRMPLGLSVNNPKRSFCPHCKNQIPWQQNLPLFSWLALRGKCAKCKAPISARYFGVELLTALLFLAIWLRFEPPGPWVLVLPYWILTSLLVVATFIDLEHFIIPDEVTWGGVVVGIALSFAVPPMMGESSPLTSGLMSVVGAAVGYGFLWAVVELGKLAFGKKKLKLAQPETFRWVRKGEDAELTIGEETLVWSEIFSRESDVLQMKCPEFVIGSRTYGDVEVRFHYDRLLLGASELSLEKLDEIHGTATAVVIPREAMGFGDVKFIAAIGAFLGWQAVFFTVFSASLVGAAVGMLTVLIGKREWSAKIPFGPYLALGALIWMFAGWEIVEWYLSIAAPVQQGSGF